MHCTLHAVVSLVLLALPARAIALSEAPLDPPDPAYGNYYTPFPTYPIAALRRSSEAYMLVELSVDDRGEILKARVNDLIGDRALGAHAARFARARWKAVVRTRGGKPVSYRINVPVVFVVDGSERLQKLVRQANHPRLRAIPPVGKVVGRRF